MKKGRQCPPASPQGHLSVEDGRPGTGACLACDPGHSRTKYFRVAKKGAGTRAGPSRRLPERMSSMTKALPPVT
jgi:hypothetical protein